MEVEVLCVGHAAFDVSMLVPSFPSENSKCEIHELIECGGGPAANAAFLLSSWGVNSAFAGVVGDDPYGHAIQAEFETVCTDTSLLEVRPGHTTPFSVILVSGQNGSRTIINRKAATTPLRLDAEKARACAPRFLLFDGHELEASLQALDLFPEAISILDGGSVRPGTLELLGKVDYLAASEGFAGQLTGIALENQSDQQTCLHKLIERSQTTTIITLGERGLVGANGSGFHSLPAFRAKAIDTTGAGDVFHGAFVYALTKAMPFLESLKLASMAASLSVQVRGGRTSIPSLDEVREALSHAK